MRPPGALTQLGETRVDNLEPSVTQVEIEFLLVTEMGENGSVNGHTNYREEKVSLSRSKTSCAVAAPHPGLSGM